MLSLIIVCRTVSDKTVDVLEVAEKWKSKCYYDVDGTVIPCSGGDFSERRSIVFSFCSK